MHKFNFKNLRPKQRLINDLRFGAMTVGSIALGVGLYWWVPAVSRGTDYIVKFLALWVMYGTLWFLASSALVLLRGKATIALKLQDAFVLGMFSAIAHAVVWYFWW